MKKVIALLLSAIFFLPSAGAELVGINSQTLADCLTDRAYRLYRDRILQSEASVADQRAVFFPTVSGELAANETRQGAIDSRFNSVSATVSQKIFDPASMAALDASKAGFIASKNGVSQQILSDGIAATDQLVQIQTLINEDNLILSRLKSFEDWIQVLSVSVKVGLADSSDLLQARQQVLGDRAQEKQLAYQIEKERAQFSAKYGFLPPDIQNFQTDRDVKISVEDLPSVKTVGAEALQAKYQASQATRALLPQLALQGSVYTTTGSSINYASGPTAVQSSARLVLDLSGLWAGAGRRSALNQIKDQKLNQVEQAEREAAATYDQIDRELMMLADQIPLLEERLNLALQSREVLKAKLRLGKVGFLELQQIEESILSAGRLKVSTLNREKQLRIQKELSVIFSSNNAVTSRSCSLPLSKKNGKTN